MNKPTKGGIVMYTVAQSDVAELKGLGGNCHRYKPGDEVPAIITNVWGDECVNLKILTDGPNDYWATSVNLKSENCTERCWAWPERV